MRRDAKRSIRDLARANGIRWIVPLFGFAVLGSACGSGTSDPDGGALLDFYDGETITIVVPATAGNAQDITARFYADWLPRYFDGDVTFVIENMPGGGQLIAANYYGRQAERDGLTTLMGGSTVHLSWRFGLPAVDFDLAGDEPLSAIGGGYMWVASPEYSGMNSLDDLIDGNHEDLYIAAQAIGSADIMNEVFPFHLLGADVEVTWGYAGGADTFAAFQRGEANIYNTSFASYMTLVEPLVESGEAVVLFSMGRLQPDGQMARDPFWPDVPHIGEVYEMMHGQAPSGNLWEGIRLGQAVGGTVGRTLWIHGDAPEAARDAFRQAFARAVEDPEFIEASVEVLGIAPATGQDLRDSVQNLLFDVDAGIIDFVIDFAIEHFDTDLREGTS